MSYYIPRPRTLNPSPHTLKSMVIWPAEVVIHACLVPEEIFGPPDETEKVQVPDEIGTRVDRDTRIVIPDKARFKAFVCSNTGRIIVRSSAYLSKALFDVNVVGLGQFGLNGNVLSASATFDSVEHLLDFLPIVEVLIPTNLSLCLQEYIRSDSITGIGLNRSAVDSWRVGLRTGEPPSFTSQFLGPPTQLDSSPPAHCATD